MWTLPNILTLARIVMIPLFVVCFYLPYAHSAIVAAVVFGLAAITDWLDGYLARKLRQTSPLGAFLDPVADKLMVAVVLVVLLQSRPEVWLALPVAVIIGREIAVSALREWMAQVGSRAKVAVSWLGKAKTALQMLALVTMTAGSAEIFTANLYLSGVAMLYLATVLTLWSMIEYLILAWPELSRQ